MNSAVARALAKSFWTLDMVAIHRQTFCLYPSPVCLPSGLMFCCDIPCPFLTAIIREIDNFSGQLTGVTRNAPPRYSLSYSRCFTLLLARRFCQAICEFATCYRTSQRVSDIRHGGHTSQSPASRLSPSPQVPAEPTGLCYAARFPVHS